MQKLSAIKRKQGNPNFKQQQQAPANSGGSTGNGKGKKQCGKCGAGKKQKEHVHEIVSAIQPSTALLTRSFPHPLTARIADVTPAGITSRLALPSSTSHTYGKPNQFPKFKKVCNLARSLDVVPMPQVQRNLYDLIADEPVASGSNVTLDAEDCTPKHAQSKEPLDWGSDIGNDIVMTSNNKDFGQVPSPALLISATNAHGHADSLAM